LGVLTFNWYPGDVAEAVVNSDAMAVIVFTPVGIVLLLNVAVEAEK
jgi:hypothetical protein